MSLCQNILQFHVSPNRVNLLSDEAVFDQLEQVLSSRGVGVRQNSVALPNGRLVLYVDAESGR